MEENEHEAIRKDEKEGQTLGFGVSSGASVVPRFAGISLLLLKPLHAAGLWASNPQIGDHLCYSCEASWLSTDCRPGDEEARD